MGMAGCSHEVVLMASKLDPIAPAVKRLVVFFESGTIEKRIKKIVEEGLREAKRARLTNLRVQKSPEYSDWDKLRSGEKSQKMQKTAVEIGGIYAKLKLEFARVREIWDKVNAAAWVRQHGARYIESDEELSQMLEEMAADIEKQWGK